MCRRVRLVVLRIIAAVAIATAAVGLACAQTPQAGTALRITLDADAVEIIRAARRQQGIDPPDAAADARVAELLRVASRRVGAAVPAPTAASASVASEKP